MDCKAKNNLFIWSFSDGIIEVINDLNIMNEEYEQNNNENQ